MTIAIDTETVPFSIGMKAPPMVCLSHSDGKNTSLLHQREARPFVERILNEEEKIVSHNLAFDAAVICAKWPDLIPKVFDAYDEGRMSCTIVREKIIDIANGHRQDKGRMYSLKAIGARRRMFDLDKTLQSTYEQYLDVPISAWPQDAINYACDDAQAHYDLYEAQGPTYRDEADQCRASFALTLASIWGFKTAPDRVEALRKKVERRAARYRRLLVRHALLRLDGRRNTKEAGARMLRAKPHGPKTPTGKPSLTITSCEESGDPILVCYARYSSTINVINKDLVFLSNPLVHTFFDSLKATGRVSSSGPNIQNPRRLPGIRECFVPRAGRVFVDCDYDGLELRTLAQVCLSVLGHSALARALNAGRDPHLEVAATILQAAYAPVEIAYKTKTSLVVGSRTYTYAEVKNTRDCAKVANFGFPGGLGAFTLVKYAKQGYGVTIQNPEELKAQWLRTWPEMREFFTWINQHATGGASQVTASNGDSYMIDHYKVIQLFSKRIRDKASFPAACNTMFQGLGSDAAKRAHWLITRACYAETDSPLYGSRVVNFIHDQFLVEVPEERGHECAREVQRLMIKGAKEWLPDLNVTCEPLLCRRWSKKAEQIVNDNGQIIPWDDVA